MDTAKQHQMRIAYKTLKMTPAGARIMGGMDYETAYALVFRTELRPRLESLVIEYGDNPPWISWELAKYGYTTPKELLDLL